MVFTGDEYADGGNFIAKTLSRYNAKASFFFTGNFYRNPLFNSLIRRLQKGRHYLGGHSDRHLLYCDWTKRDSLLVTKRQFKYDLSRNYDAMRQFGLKKTDATYFLPPFEWYNDSISQWATESGLQIVNFSPGTSSNADYTYPAMGTRYRSSDVILQTIINQQQKGDGSLNGFILLVHIGTHPERKDKFYLKLPGLISQLKNKGYEFVTIKRLIELNP